MQADSSILAWKIPWAEEPGRLQSMGSQRVRHDWATSLSLFTFMHWRRKWQRTPMFLPRESQGWGSLVGCRLWGRTESRTQLKWLSSSSSSIPTSHVWGFQFLHILANLGTVSDTSFRHSYVSVVISQCDFSLVFPMSGRDSVWFYFSVWPARGINIYWVRQNFFTNMQW